MTLIAVCRSRGGVALVGDLLVTAPAGAIDPTGFSLPTRPDVTDRQRFLGRQPYTMKQKAVLLSPRVAVAWSGNYAAAETLLRALKQVHDPAGGSWREELDAVRSRHAPECRDAALMALGPDGAGGWSSATIGADETLVTREYGDAGVSIRALGSGALDAYAHGLMRSVPADDPGARAFAWTNALLSAEGVADATLERHYGGSFQIVVGDHRPELIVATRQVALHGVVTLDPPEIVFRYLVLNRYEEGRFVLTTVKLNGPGVPSETRVHKRTEVSSTTSRRATLRVRRIGSGQERWRLRR